MAIISGRTVIQNGARFKPAVDAAVKVTGIWRHPVSSHLVVHPVPAHLVFVRPPLYFDLPANKGRMRIHRLRVIENTQAMLLEFANAGTLRLRISALAGLQEGDLLVLDPDSPDRCEYLHIAKLYWNLAQVGPGQLLLAHPLAYSHNPGTILYKAELKAVPGKSLILAEDSRAGSFCLLLKDLGVLPKASVVHISGGSSPASIHQLLPYIATSNTQGYYRLPPIGRVAQMEIEASHENFRSIKTVFSPDYRRAENRIDFVFH